MGRQPESRPKGQGLQGLEGLQWEQVASQSAEQGSQRQDGEAGFARTGPRATAASLGRFGRGVVWSCTEGSSCDLLLLTCLREAWVGWSSESLG